MAQSLDKDTRLIVVISILIIIVVLIGTLLLYFRKKENDSLDILFRLGQRIDRIEEQMRSIPQSPAVEKGN